MADSASKTSPKPRRRFRRWLVRLLLLGLVFVGLIAAFHRPLILWALNRFGPEGAKRAGIELGWQVGGSLWSDLALDKVSARGKNFAAKIGHLEVRYDVQPAWRRDWFKIPRGLVLHDVEAIIDLRDPVPPAAPGKPSPPLDRKALMDMLHQIVLPDIEFHHITVTVFMPDAALTINDFSLDLPSGKEGNLSIASIEHPQLMGLPQSNITARLKVSPTAVEITSLKFPPQLEVKKIKIDANDFADGKVALYTVVQSGKAGVDLHTSVDIKNGPPLIDASLDITGVDDEEVSMWLPSLPEWTARLNKFHVSAKGDPMKPRSFMAVISVDADQLGYQKWKGGQVNLEAQLAHGKLHVSELTAAASGNRISVTTSADAPAEWADFAHTPLDLRWKLDAPALNAVAGLPVKLGGRIKGDGSVKLDDQGLQSFAATISAQDLSADQSKLRSLDAKLTGDLKAIVFEAKALADAGDGVVDAKGSIGLEPGKPSDATWKVVLPQPAALVKSLGVAWPEDIAAGAVALDGEAHFDLAQLKASKFDQAKAKGSLTVKDIAWKGAPCPLVSASYSLADGKATVSALDVTLPSTNRVHAEGSLELAGSQSFAGALHVLLPDLPGLQPFVDAAAPPPPADTSHTVSAVLLGPPDGTAPPPVAPPKLLGGNIQLDWNGKGSLKDGLKLEGKASLNVHECKVDRMPESASLVLQTTHDLASATIQSLAATFGPWAVKLNGTLAKTGVNLANIEASHSDKRLITGAIQIPLDFEAKPLPLDKTRSMQVKIASDGNLALTDLASIAQAKLPSGLAGTVSTLIECNGTYPALLAKVEVKAEGLRVPQMPGKDPGKVDLTVLLDNGALTVDLHALANPIEPVTAHVSSKVDIDALATDPSLAMKTPFEASVNLNQRSLDFIKPMAPMLDDLKGSVLLDVNASGTGVSPHIGGALVLDVPSIEPHDPDLPLVKNLKARITADGTLIKVETFSGVVAGGEISASGTCDLKDTAQPAFNVSLKARDLLVMRNEMLSQRTDADLALKGTPKAASLSGTIGLTRGRVFQEVNFLPLSKLMNDLPPLPDAQAGKPSAEANASLLPPALAGWTFDVALKTKDSIRLLGNVLNGGVNVDVHLGGNGVKPLITGDVKLDNARLNLPFSTLRIKTGDVTMVPERPLAPNLELLAEATVDAYDISLRGHGSVLDPKLRFTSNPPLAEGEIATLLATGSTTSGLKKAGDDAAGRALLFVVREAYRRAFNSNAKPQRKDEKPSESRFIVQERTEDGALGGVTGIYEFSRKMKIVGSTNKEGGFRAMFHYLFHFD